MYTLVSVDDHIAPPAARGSKARSLVQDRGALGVGSWHDGTWDPLTQLRAETETPIPADAQWGI